MNWVLGQLELDKFKFDAFESNNVNTLVFNLGLGAAVVLSHRMLLLKSRSNNPNNNNSDAENEKFQTKHHVDDDVKIIPANDYIENTFHEALNLFQEEKKTLRKKIADLNQLVASKDQLIASLEEKLRAYAEAEKSTKNQLDNLAKEIEVKTRTIDQTQVELASLSDSNVELNAVSKKLEQTIQSLQKENVDNNSNQSEDPIRLAEIIDRLFIFVDSERKQLNSVPLTPTSPHAKDIEQDVSSEIESESNISVNLPGTSTGNDRTIDSQNITLLQKLTDIQNFLEHEYLLQRTKNSEKTKMIVDMKAQINKFKLLKVKEVTDLHRDMIELQKFYEAKEQQKPSGGIGLSPTKVSPTKNLHRVSVNSDLDGDVDNDLSPAKRSARSKSPNSIGRPMLNLIDILTNSSSNASKPSTEGSTSSNRKKTPNKSRSKTPTLLQQSSSSNFQPLVQENDLNDCAGDNNNADSAVESASGEYSNSNA
jgi:hypothetical protein